MHPKRHLQCASAQFASDSLAEDNDVFCVSSSTVVLVAGRSNRRLRRSDRFVNQRTRRYGSVIFRSDQRTRAFYRSAYPFILQISVPVDITGQRTRRYYGSAYPCILRISVPVHFTDQRRKEPYPCILQISVPVQRTSTGSSGIGCADSKIYGSTPHAVIRKMCGYADL
jgi:hypothetical protein